MVLEGGEVSYQTLGLSICAMVKFGDVMGHLLRLYWMNKQLLFVTVGDGDPFNRYPISAHKKGHVNKYGPQNTIGPTTNHFLGGISYLGQVCVYIYIHMI